VTRPRVVIAGIGPAGPELVTGEVSAAIGRIKHRYLRTARHPSAAVVPNAIACDDLYESADTFDDVYRRIVDRIVDGATQHGEVLYAVPGSPHVLERSVRWLIANERVETTVLPGMSFLDLAYARLGIDPIEATVTLIDAHMFTRSAAGRTGPLLVAHTHDRRTLSDVKLAIDDAPTEPVTVLQRLGLPDEAVFQVQWADLDRVVDPDHLTCLYIPHLDAPVAGELMRFYEVVRQLRTDCPWDRKQTHQSLARYALEESYELVEAIAAVDPERADTDEALIDELGDVLLQVVLHAAIGEQEGRFNLAEVATGITDKMIRRHPHVFGDVEVSGAEQVIMNWEAIKRAEKEGKAGNAAAAPTSAAPTTSSVDGVPGHLPALSYANEIAKKAAKAGIDWDDPRGTIDKVREEIDEVVDAWDEPIAVSEEIGDLLFAVVNMARHRGVDPEVAMRQAAAKFRTRVIALEALAVARGLDTRTCGVAVLDELWNAVKLTEKPATH